MPSNSFIEFRNVFFAYRTRSILSNISLSVPQGKLVAVMGGSGSGKTTLLRLISGQYRPQQGEVIVAGKNVATMSSREQFDHRRNMGALFQFGALFTDLTVFENVAFPLREHTTLPESMIHDLVALKLNAVGLHGTQHLMPAELSGGMARRVALSRAIALDPALMLYDEPFTGLDPITLGVIAHLIKKLNDALGTTAIMVTHDVHTSLQIVDHVYFISNGEIVAAGTPDEVRASNCPWVQQFICGKTDGPIQFTYPARTSLMDELGLTGDVDA